MPGPESNRDFLPQFEGYVRELGISPRHAEFFRHVYVELDAFLDRRVLQADSSRFDAFLRAKVQAGLSEKRQRAYRQVLDHILSFRRTLVSEDTDDLSELLEQGMGLHAAGALAHDAPAEMPGESTRAINDAPLLARSAMARASAGPRVKAPSTGLLRGGGGGAGPARGERLSTLQGNSLYDDDDDDGGGLFGGNRSTTAIPDFMEASAAPEADDVELFDPLFDDQGPGSRDELITFDGDLPASRAFDDLPAASAPRGRRGQFGDATPMPEPKRSVRRPLSSFDDDDDLPSVGGSPQAAPWARASATREVGDELPSARSSRPGMSVKMPDSGPTRIARPTPASGSQRARRVSRSQSQPTPPRPARAVEVADPDDPLGLFGDLELPTSAPDPLNPTSSSAARAPSSLAQRPISALFDASAPSESGARAPASLMQATDSGIGLPAPSLGSSHNQGFERRNTIKGVGAVGRARPPSNQAVAQPSTPAPANSARPTSVTDAPPGGAVAFSKLGMLEPGNAEAPIEVADDDEIAAPDPASTHGGASSSGPMLRSVDVPSEVVARAKPIPGATESREDAMRRARKRLSKSIEKAERSEPQQTSRARRFRPFVYDGRFTVDRPAPASSDCTLVDPRPVKGLGSVLKLAALPVTLTLIGALALLLGLTAGLGMGPLASLGAGGWGLVGVGLLLVVAFGVPTARWLASAMRPLRQNTPDAALRSYHEALWTGNTAAARRCLAMTDEAPPLPDDFDVRQKRQIGEAFNQLDAATFERYWFVQHPLARVGGLAAISKRGRPGELGETRLVAGSVDSGTVLLLVELPDKEHYWLVPQVRVEGLWYLVDGQLYWRTTQRDG